MCLSKEKDGDDFKFQPDAAQLLRQLSDPNGHLRQLPFCEQP